ncbi:hypothetical protein [Falsiroseomonas sp. HW251]|uniref:hypothetical protein n=1 Tax=Falsiroseomonas sp. HW251 TaxID=3390998 RepID=UPI003D3206E8
MLLDLWLANQSLKKREAAMALWREAEFERLSDEEFSAVLGIAENQLGHDVVIRMCRARLGQRRGVPTRLEALRRAWHRACDHDQDASAAVWSLIANVAGSRWVRMGLVTLLIIAIVDVFGLD